MQMVGPKGKRRNRLSTAVGREEATSKMVGRVEIWTRTKLSWDTVGGRKDTTTTEKGEEQTPHQASQAQGTYTGKIKPNNI